MDGIVGVFLQGGPLMWPLLLCSLLAVTVVIERSLFWFRHGKAREQSAPLLERALDRMREGDGIGAASLLQSCRTPAARMLSTVCDGQSEPAVMERAAIPILRACRRGLRLLDTVVTVAPMLGLLGTVVGVIQSFGFVGASSEGSALNMKVVGGGIAEALITTAFGLAIAIISVVPYNYFSSRVQQEAEELSSLATEMEEALDREDTLRT